MPTNSEVLSESHAPVSSFDHTSRSRIFRMLSAAAALAALAVTTEQAHGQIGLQRGPRPVPAPAPAAVVNNEEAKKPLAQALSIEQQLHPAIADWLKNTHPDISPEEVRKLMEAIDAEQFRTRQRGEVQMKDVVGKRVGAINPVPGFTPDGKTPEQQRRLRSIEAIMQDHPSCVPVGLKGTGEALVQCVSEITGNPLRYATAHVKKKLEEVTHEVAKGRNDYFTLIGDLCEKADLHWTVEQGHMVLREGKGMIAPKPVAVSGKYGMFEIERERGANVLASHLSRMVSGPERTIIGEPGHARVVSKGMAHYPGDKWKAHPGSPMLGNGYNGIIKSQNIDPDPAAFVQGNPGSSSVNARFTAATGGSEKYFPLNESSEGHVGMQHVTVEPREYNDAHGAQICVHVWPNVSWSSTYYQQDMQAWNTATGVSMRLLDKDGQEIPHRLIIIRIEERRMYFTMKALDGRKPVGIRIRGQKNMTNETRTFNPVPARMTEAIRSGGPGQK